MTNNDIISYLNNTTLVPELAIFSDNSWSLIADDNLSISAKFTGKLTEWKLIFEFIGDANKMVRYFHLTETPVIAVAIGDDVSIRFPMPAENAWLSNISNVPTPDEFTKKYGDQAIEDGFIYSAAFVDPRLFTVYLMPDKLFGVVGCVLSAVNGPWGGLIYNHSPEFSTTFWPAGIVGYEEIEGIFALIKSDSTGQPIADADGPCFIEYTEDVAKRFADHGFTVVTEDIFNN